MHTPVSSAVRFLYSYSSPSINASVGQDRLEINSNTSSLKKRMLEVDISNPTSETLVNPQENDVRRAKEKKLSWCVFKEEIVKSKNIYYIFLSGFYIVGTAYVVLI